ncbi:protein unc-93 homolog A-like [Ostrea edulis]|uniref:protein unc-93 homolog A-like n=1 Tax=Ostrea edulis TaxID=37623 RepID=UPI0024AEAF29|nr:protein unc-93 homolog A-like [Ostrea edulis]
MCLRSCCKLGNDLSGKERRTVISLSIIFVVVFSGFHGIQNLQSTINNESGRGVISLSVVYGCFVLSSFFAPSFIRVLTAKGCLITGCISHLVYAASNLYPVFWTLLSASAFVGLTSGLLWTSQGMYISQCAISFSQTKNVPMKKIFGKFHGIFYFGFAFPRVVGNCLSSIILMQGQYNETTNNVSKSERVKSCGAELCPEMSVTQGLFLLPDPLIVKILMAAFTTLSIIGLLLCVFLLPPLPITVTSSQKSVARKMLSASFSCLLVNTEVAMLLFIPSVLLHSFVESFLWIDISKAYISCPFGVEFVGFSMALNGVLNGISSFLLPRLANLIGRKYVMTSLIIGITASYVGFLVWMPTDDGLPQIMGIVAVQGLLEGGLCTLLATLLSSMYTEKTDAAFASLETWKALGNTVNIGLAYYLCERSRLYIMFALCTLSIISYVALEMHLQKKTKLTEVDYEEENETINVELRGAEDSSDTK